jgi:PEGA domain-containing protein
MRPSPLAVLLASALAAGTACLTVSPLGISFASEPPGARVWIDGRDSGWVTPCQIALDQDVPHDVTITLPGHEPRVLRLVPDERKSFVTWPLGIVSIHSSVTFPLLLPSLDLLFPMRQTETLSPSRIFVRLRPEEAS